MNDHPENMQRRTDGSGSKDRVEKLKGNFQPGVFLVPFIQSKRREIFLHKSMELSTVLLWYSLDKMAEILRTRRRFAASPPAQSDRIDADLGSDAFTFGPALNDRIE